jgi:hypothetical protein
VRACSLRVCILLLADSIARLCRGVELIRVSVPLRDVSAAQAARGARVTRALARSDCALCAAAQALTGAAVVTVYRATGFSARRSRSRAHKCSHQTNERRRTAAQYSVQTGLHVRLLRFPLCVFVVQALLARCQWRAAAVHGDVQEAVRPGKRAFNVSWVYKLANSGRSRPRVIEIKNHSLIV